MVLQFSIYRTLAVKGRVSSLEKSTFTKIDLQLEIIEKIILTKRVNISHKIKKLSLSLTRAHARAPTESKAIKSLGESVNLMPIKP